MIEGSKRKMLEVEENTIRYDNVKLKSGFHYRASVSAHYITEHTYATIVLASVTVMEYLGYRVERASKDHCYCMQLNAPLLK